MVCFKAKLEIDIRRQVFISVCSKDEGSCLFFAKVQGDRLKKQKKIVINRDNVEEFVRSRNTSKDYSNKTRMQRQKLYIQTYNNQLKTKLTNDYSITLQKMYDFYSKLKQLVLQLFYEEDKQEGCFYV